ncbi:hypothetical protein HZ326_14427 [Fusarium oxysporum f. sp. albedinis]|nr:hypothetical protein HZ326_14427 [Fusarium oxysporum f. sp. albedinis]
MYNIRKSRDIVMATLLRDPDIGQYDILAIQEPWKNLFDTITYHLVKDQFHLCYLDKDESGLARVCFFINKRLNHSRWHFKEVSKDLCLLNLGGDRVQQADPNAIKLITIIEDYCLTSNLASGTIIYEEGDGRITIDLCLITTGLVDRLIRCKIKTEIDYDSNYLPIVTLLDLNII